MWSLDSDHASVGVFVIHVIGLAKINRFAKFVFSSFARSKFIKEVLKFKTSARTLATRFWGYFVIGLVKIYQCIKFGVSSFIRSKDTAQVPCNGWMRESVCPY